MGKETKLIASGVAQANTGQTSIIQVPKWSRSLILYLNVTAVGGTTPLTDFKLRYVVPKMAGVPVVATASAGGADANEVQTLSLSGGLATETVKLTYNGHESDAITFPTGGFANTTAAQVKTALLTISDWTSNTADIAVVKATNDYAITFSGLLGNTDLTAITVTNPTGAGAGSVAETTKGRGGEVQTITMTGGPTHGTFRIRWTGVSANVDHTTNDIPVGASVRQVQDAIDRAIPGQAATVNTYAGKDIVVTGSGIGTSGNPTVYRLTFSGPTVANLNVDAVTVDSTKLYTYTTSTTFDFAGWDGITQIVGTTAAEVMVIVGPDEADTSDDVTPIYQVQSVLPERLAAVLTFDRADGNETYTYSLYASYV